VRQGELVVFESSGHLTFVEENEACIRDVRDFSSGATPDPLRNASRAPLSEGSIKQLRARGIAQALQELPEEFRLIYVDHRGVGRSDKPTRWRHTLWRCV
jgi:pimeloyl-ACP methyl ester carboxylesterase